MIIDGKHTRRAVTLAELIISLIITSLLALGVASILHAASYGTSSKRDVRRIVIRSQQVRNRLDDAIRNARSVLASGDGYIVLWTGGEDDQVNLSEIQLIEMAGGTTQLVSYQAPSTIDPDPIYEPSANFYQEADKARDAGDLQATVWSDHVSDLSVTLDNSTATGARLVTWSLTLTNELLDESVSGVVACRCDPTKETCEPQ